MVCGILYTVPSVLEPLQIKFFVSLDEPFVIQSRSGTETRPFPEQFAELFTSPAAKKMFSHTKTLRLCS